MSLKYLLLLMALPCAAAISAQPIRGCTDRAANNYNPAATINDGSCTYDPASINPSLRFNQQAGLEENSGMIYWNGHLWQHNDGGAPPVIFATDTATGRILRRVTLTGALNTDWEDMAQDDRHIFIGDFGNNDNGARKDLRIYRITKSDLSSTEGDISVTPELISFRYQDQPDSLMPMAGNKTDFDCEAMIVHEDRLYLFTKQWSSKQTSLYTLPKSPGYHTAVKLATYDVKGLVTGADIYPSTGTIILTGYTQTLQRFMFLLYDFKANAFFEGNKRKVMLKGIAQTESVAFFSRHLAFIGSEKAAIFPQRLESIDLSALLEK